MLFQIFLRFFSQLESYYSTIVKTSRTSRGVASVAGASEESPSTVITVNDNEIRETSNIPDPWGRNMKLLFCFLGLQLSYITWGVVQEQVMTQEYRSGKFKSSAFCVFGNRFLALFLSLGIIIYKRQTSKKPLKDAPFYYYAPSSLSNSLSSWAQYEALKFISFPSQVLSKSCKLIPVMLVGILVNKKTYPLLEYLEAVMITIGVTLFTLTEKTGPAIQREDTAWGFALLALYLSCDSFTSQWQSKVYKQYSIDQYQMMLGVNVWSMIMTGITLIQSGEGLESLQFVLNDSTAMMHMVILSITSAIGQLFIFYTIKEFGPVIFTIVMTTRQIFSLVVSCFLFSHPLSVASGVGALMVFLIVFNRIRRKGTD